MQRKFFFIFKDLGLFFGTFEALEVKKTAERIQPSPANAKVWPLRYTWGKASVTDFALNNYNVCANFGLRFGRLPLHLIHHPFAAEGLSQKLVFLLALLLHPQPLRKVFLEETRLRHEWELWQGKASY